MYREITLKNNVIVLSVPFVHHILNCKNFLSSLVGIKVKLAKIGALVFFSVSQREK